MTKELYHTLKRASLRELLEYPQDILDTFFDITGYTVLKRNFK